MRLFLLLLGLTLTLSAAKIDDFAQEMGYSRDYAKAFQQAKTENKPLMLVIVADYCPWCRKMERSTLESKEVRERVGKELVTVIMDQKYDLGRFPEAYQTPRKPTIFFINPKTDQHFLESIGYVKKKEFLVTLDDVQKEFKK